MMLPDTLRDRTRQAGASLISALLIVSVMSVVSLSLLETIKHSARLSSNIADREQARFFALAAEEIVKQNLADLWEPDSERSIALDLWTQTPLLYPIPDGTIQGRVVDGANCFNLNSVVKTTDEGTIADQDSSRVFTHLLEELSVPASDAVAIAAELVDWIDSNDQTSFSGAEDDYYASLRTPYRTGGQFLADITELKSLRSMTPQLFETLKELTCVRPTPDLRPLNINTLETWQAPLFAAYLGEDYTIESALNLLQDRPVGGYDRIASFEEDLLAQENREDPRTNTQDLFSLKSDIYTVRAVISYRQASLHVQSTLQIPNNKRHQQNFEALR